VVERPSGLSGLPDPRPDRESHHEADNRQPRGCQSPQSTEERTNCDHRVTCLRIPSCPDSRVFPFKQAPYHAARHGHRRNRRKKRYGLLGPRRSLQSCDRDHTEVISTLKETQIDGFSPQKAWAGDGYVSLLPAERTGYSSPPNFSTRTPVIRMSLRFGLSRWSRNGRRRLRASTSRSLTEPVG